MSSFHSLDKFYKKNRLEKLDILTAHSWLSEKDRVLLAQNLGLTQETAHHMIENQLGLYSYPFGISLNHLINGQNYIIPMVTEEPSVIAACSNGAKLIAKAGGVSSHIQSREMIGHIALKHVPTPEEAIQQLERIQSELLDLANASYPSIVQRGGGARKLYSRYFAHETDPLLVVYLSVDVQEAMGANILNTMLEALTPRLETLTGGKALMAILSNLATNSLVTAQCKIPAEILATATISGEEVRDSIISASLFAQVDPYRATTHNKGIMNGIDAVVMATGNDWRAIEAGAHAYTSLSGSYQPLATWTLGQDGELVGSITLPLPIGTVGGSIAIHPTAQLAHRILKNPNAKQLAELIAAVGLAQNLAALRALVTDGIQKGHMRLQAKSLAIASGALPHEVDTLVSELLKAPHLNQETARDLLEQHRSKN